MLKKFKTWQILLALAVLVGVVLIVIYWTEISSKLGIARMSGGARQSGTAGLSSTYRSKGCQCVKGYIANYGYSSNYPCGQWSKFCEGTSN